MLKLGDIREKEIININNGERMGYIYDFELDVERGRITAIVMSGSVKVLGLFGKNQDMVIPWHNILKIGTDTILVDFNLEWLD